MTKAAVADFTLNGRPAALPQNPERALLDVLRHDHGLRGPKYGCGLAQCGACTVLLDDQAARSCVLRAGRVAGRRVTTLEGLADPVSGALHPLQAAFVAAQAAQCGYCLNGMVMTAVALLRQNPDPSEAEIRTALRDTLCRCGAHQEIIAAIRAAARPESPA